MKKFSLILVIILIFSCLGSGLTSIAFAASETIYTGVLEDLSKDETFDVSKHPTTNECKMDVIQIAESSDGELFLYVYVPVADKITASEARISTTIGENLAPKDYKLTLLDSSGTLQKYKVEGLQVKSDVVRYYLIVHIARPWNGDIDRPSLQGDSLIVGNESINEINTVAYTVGKLYTVCTLDGAVTYAMEYQEVIPIVNKRVGYLRYTERSPFLSMLGYGSVGETIDSHYVAFSTDKPIDKLYEIDISYSTIVCHKDTVVGVTTETEDEPQTVTETYTADNYASVDIMHKTYEWKRIQRLNDFVTTEPTLPEDTKKDLSEMTWVLRFLETKVTTSRPTNMLIYRTHTRVEEVTILRLKFDLDGVTYNLGVVDNKQSEIPGQKPDNEADSLLDKLRLILADMEAFWEKCVNAFKWLVEHWWVIIVGIVGIALVIGLVIAFVKFGFKAVFKIIGKGLWYLIKYLFIGLGYVLASPVLLIIWIFRKVKERKQ